MKGHIALACLALALGSGALAGAAFSRDGGVIRNSGSTNAPGYTIKVWSDGSTWAVHSGRTGSPQGTPVTGHVPESLAREFIEDAREARAKHAPAARCMKSASFGSVTTVLYHGWTSPDIQCPVAGELSELKTAVNRIVSLTGAEAMPGRRIPMLPNEPRRVPTEGASSRPSATPEPAGPAS